MPENDTLRDLVGRLGRATARTAIVGPQPVSYADLHARALRLAAGLRSLGLKQGDTIAVQLPNSVEFLLCYLAAGYIGATLQTVHMPYRGAEVETLLAHSGAAAAVCLAHGKDGSPAEMILSRNLPHLRHVIAVGQPPAGALAFASLLATPPDEVLAPVAATDRFLLLYTSGTTAAPKGVPVDYRRFLVNAALSAAELKVDEYVDPALGRAVLASLRPVLGQPRLHDRRRDRDPADVHAGRARGRARPMPSDRTVRRAGAHVGLPQRGPADARAAFVAALRADLRQRLSSRAGARRAGAHAERQSAAALGHERIAGRHVHPAGRPARRAHRQRGARKPGHASCASPTARRRSPRARRANCRCAAARCSKAISTMPTPPPRRSPPTAGSAPAISRGSMRPAIF